MLDPIQNDREMGMSLDALAIKLSVTPVLSAAVQRGVRVTGHHQGPDFSGAGAVHPRDGVR